MQTTNKFKMLHNHTWDVISCLQGLIILTTNYGILLYQSDKNSTVRINLTSIINMLLQFVLLNLKCWHHIFLSLNDQ